MKRSPMRRVSKGMARKLAVYRRDSRAYLELHPICEICGLDPSEVVHHGRGRGIYLLEQKYWKAASNKCHESVERSRAWAIKNGHSFDRIGINP